jgi:protein-S-isoprenylcysteine O-methyltransferase Ste14
MGALDLRVPPLVVVVLLGVAMWGIGRVAPGLYFDYPGRTVLACLVGLLGLVVVVIALSQFRRHQTTPDPIHPENSTAIVTTGIYGRTRNPMYLGMLLWLVAWATWLSNPVCVPGPIVFVLYMNRFQIAPEERALSASFGAPYEQYLRTVRRWI